MLARAVRLPMAGVTQRGKGLELMGPRSFGVMDVEMFPRATSHALEVVPHFGPELSFRHVERFVAVGIWARNPYPERINTFVRACFPQRVLHVGPGFLV